MSRDATLVRQWILLKTLSARHYGVTVQEMARELTVAQKTIRRDLETFIGVGLPVEETVGEHGQKRWHIRSGNQPDLTFSFDEALALYLGRRLLEPLAGTLLWEAAQSAFQKIRACLGKTALDYLEKMAGNLHHTSVGKSDYSKKSDLIDALMQGIEQRQATIIEYQSLQATEPVTYEVYPYALTYHRGSLYLVAHSTDHRELRHFKVDRMEKAEVGPFKFTMPKGFNVEDHLAKSFGVFHGDGEVTVKIKFLPTVARYVSESQWHDSQKLTRQRDGSLLAEFHLSDTEEIKRWVYGFGANAVVLEPESLRAEMAAELAAAQRWYQSEPEKPRRSVRRSK